MLTLASRIQRVEDRIRVSLASPLLARRPAGLFPQTGLDLSAPGRRGFCQRPGYKHDNTAKKRVSSGLVSSPKITISSLKVPRGDFKPVFPCV